MQRKVGKVGHGVLQRDPGQSGNALLKRLKIFPHDTGEVVCRLLVELGRAKEGQLDGGRGHVLLLTRIRPGGDDIARIPGVLLLQRVNERIVHGEQSPVGRRRHLGDCRVAKPRHDPGPVELTVAHEVDRLGEAHKLRSNAVGIAKPRLLQVQARLNRGGGARRAGGKAQPRKVGKTLGAAGSGHNNLIGVVVEPCQNAQIFIGRALEAALPLLRLPQKRGHGKAQLGLAFGKQTQILNAACRSLRRHPNALEVLPPKGGKRAAKRVERACRRRGGQADLHRGLLGWRTASQQQNQRHHQEHPFFHHWFLFLL